jgi:RimJ/RimL family protein N-acetyltransferase
MGIGVSNRTRFAAYARIDDGDWLGKGLTTTPASHRRCAMRRLNPMPTILTPRLRLRPLTVADAPSFWQITAEVAAAGAIHFLHAPFTLADAKSLIAGNGDGRDCFWGAWRRAEADLIGAVGTHLRGDDRIEIGYWFGEASRGRGFAYEATAGVIGALEEAFPERRIFAECRPHNTASWRLLLKLGFCPDGSDGAAAGRKILLLTP